MTRPLPRRPPRAPRAQQAPHQPALALVLHSASPRARAQAPASFPEVVSARRVRPSRPRRSYALALARARCQPDDPQARRRCRPQPLHMQSSKNRGQMNRSQTSRWLTHAAAAQTRTTTMMTKTTTSLRLGLCEKRWLLRVCRHRLHTGVRGFLRLHRAKRPGMRDAIPYRKLCTSRYRGQIWGMPHPRQIRFKSRANRQRRSSDRMLRFHHRAIRSAQPCLCPRTTLPCLSSTKLWRRHLFLVLLRRLTRALSSDWKSQLAQWCASTAPCTTACCSTSCGSAQPDRRVRAP